MNRLGWYERVSDFILENLEAFCDLYEGKSQVTGADVRVNPCPFCGHNDCYTVGEATHCFSCSEKGTNIGMFLKYKGKKEGILQLEEFAKLKYPRDNSPENKKYARIQEIRSIAVEFYHKKLMTLEERYEYNNSHLTPLEYQLKVRGHKEESMLAFKVMFSYGYFKLRDELKHIGFSDDEIKEAKIWFPEGLFVYPYIHPTTGDIVRFNAKNPFKVHYKDKEVKGFSVGFKFPMFSPRFSFKRDCEVVEGENDLITLYENGYANSACIGGSIGEESVEIFNKCESKIFTIFDNDEAGEKYFQLFDSFLPHKDVRKVVFTKEYNDPDDLLRYSDIDLKALESKAEFTPTKEYKISHKGDFWKIENRSKILTFEITSTGKHNSPVGIANYYILKEDKMELDDREEGKSLSDLKAKMKPFKFILSDYITLFFNDKLEEKSLNDLVYVYKYTNQKGRVLRLIAKLIYKLDEKEKEEVVNDLKVKLGGELTDVILKEINDLVNCDLLDKLSFIPSMRVSQYFNLSNNDAYVYFSRQAKDGEAIKRIPYLLRNDGHQIRLDLYKRSDPQCLILIDSKYELRQEVPTTISDPMEVSLLEDYANRYSNGDVGDEEINPGKIIVEIEDFVRKFYYFKDGVFYKLLALYIYSTYFYEMMNSFPYLLLNGEKGSGKSTLDKVLHQLCFNAKLAVNISEASMFRMVANEGGTLILDEIENMTSRSKNADNGLAQCLKAGYKRAGNTYRINMEANRVEGFDLYGPKVISNVFGVDDILEDRCVVLNTYRVNAEERVKLDSPQRYERECMLEIRELTSRCCLSALKYFQTLGKILESPKAKIKTAVDARSQELFTSLAAVAMFVDWFILGDETKKPEEIEDGGFLYALMQYHDMYFSPHRKMSESMTPEGATKHIIETVARELIVNMENKDRRYTIAADWSYSEPIKYNLDEGWFEINTLHFSVFLTSDISGDLVTNRFITKWVKSAYGTCDIKRRTADLDNAAETLQRKYEGNKKPRVNSYRFHFSDILQMEKENNYKPF